MTTVDIDWPLWPRQREAFESIANDQLFGGASEGGKSYFTRVALCCAGMQCNGLQMTLIRKKYDDILTNHLEGDKGFRALLYPLSSKGIVEVSEKRIRFPKQNVLNFKHCQDERQFDSAQGNENQIVAVDEAPQIKERLIRAFRGWCRITPEHLARQPKFWQKKLPWFLQTGNPTGESVGYFRRHYVKARAPFAIENFGGFRRQYVPSKAQDNKSVDLEAHAARLSEIGDAELAKALDTGDWDAITGNFFHMWDSDRHVVKDFIVPDFWVRYREYDYGSYEPWACLWFAVSPGVTVHKGTAYEKYLPRGCLIIYREWYGCKAEHPRSPEEDPEGKDKLITNLAPKGWSHSDMANGIIDRTEERFDDQPIFTDGFPFHKLGGKTIADDFKDAGINLIQGETDRQNRASQTISRLNGKKMIAGSDEHWPMLVVFESCKYCQDYIPMVERHETEGRQWDYAENGEATHVVDCVTLGCVVHTVVNDAPTTTEEQVNKALKDPRNNRKTIRQILPTLPF